jgi:ABC-type multidrug transport system fused ATPase/permease subunit
MPVIMMGIGFISSAFKFCQIAGMEAFADSISHKIRMNYFKAVLEKDATWFDANNPNEIASKISTEVDVIQAGIGEKIGELCHAVMTFFIGYIIAFLIGWEYALILLGAIPMMLLSGIIMGKSAKMGMEE